MAFLTQIGLPWHMGKVPPNRQYLPGMAIQNGVLIIDPQALYHPGDVLHEAGHIAVVRAWERPALSHNLAKRHEAPGEEMAAILWSYAAARHIGIDPAVVFHENGYKGESRWLLDNFAKGVYPYLPILVYYGMTLPATPTGNTQHRGHFPKMLRWLR